MIEPINPETETVQEVKALHPTYQQALEEQAIVHRPEFLEWLGDEEWTRIDHEKGKYIIYTATRELEVLVHYKPSKCCSPRLFDLEFLF